MLLPVDHDEKTIVLNCKYKTLKNQIKRFHFFLCFFKIHGLLQSKDAQNVRLLYALHPHTYNIFPNAYLAKLSYIYHERDGMTVCVNGDHFFENTKPAKSLSHKINQIRFAR